MSRYRWVDQRPVAIVADLKVGRHDLLKMRMPDYAYPARESPVHNERCTPGSGTGAGETGGGNPDSGAPPPRSLRMPGARVFNDASGSKRIESHTTGKSMRQSRAVGRAIQQSHRAQGLKRG